MAKFSLFDKLRVKTLREQGYGAKAIRSAYPAKNWSLSMLKKICGRVDSRGSAVDRKKGSGRPRTARTADNMAAELTRSQSTGFLYLGRSEERRVGKEG